jgi:hypothetical protein
MGTANVTLYAIYRRTLTATFIQYTGSGTKTTTTAATTIYNKTTSGTVPVPSQSAYTGWTLRGWTILTTANAAAMLSPSGGTVSMGADVTLYGLYNRTLTLSYVANGGSSTPASQSGIQYANSYAIGVFANPTLTLAGAISRTGYSFDGWAVNGATGTKYAAGSSIAITTNTAMYATWKATSGDDYGNDFASAYSWTLSAGKTNSLNGNIETLKDADMFKFTAPVTGTYTFYASNKASTLGWLDGYLYNSGQSLLYSKLEVSTPISFSYGLTAGQVYYLKLDGYSGTGTYTVSVTVPS